MDKIQAYIEAWAEWHWEFTLAFEGFADEDLWKRPHPRLLSIGELAGHVAYSESLLCDPPPDSPLVDQRFAYYEHQVNDEVVLDLTVAQVLEEVKKLFEAAKASVDNVQSIDEVVPWRPDQTWMQTLQYRCFHVAYHCGQAYSVRHLMGHQTTDN